MWSAIWPVLTTLALGGAGWVAASFFAKPLLDFLTLRGQVHEEILFTDNVGPITAHRTADHERAADSLRRLGAKMQAMDVSVCRPLAQARLLSLAQAPLRRFLTGLGFDLATAGRNLIGLSNALTAVGRPLHVDKIEVALKLPRSSTDDYLQHVREQMLRPQPAEPAKEAQPPEADDKATKLDALMEKLKRDPAFHVVEGTGAAFIFMVNGPVPPKKPEG